MQIVDIVPEHARIRGGVGGFDFFTLATGGAANGTSDPGYANAVAILNGLRITEIMYNPAGGNNYEFIELTNVGGVTLNLKVRQSEVPEGFRMPVPVMIEYQDGTEDRLLVTVAKAEETSPLALPRAPKEVVFDPDVAVLARVKKE